MKRLISVFIGVIFISLFTIKANAEQNLNLLADYRNILWEGDILYYNEDYATVSFKSEGDKAFATFPTESCAGFWFYADMGNLQNKGSGHITVAFLDSSDAEIKAFTTEKNNGNGSFNRYQLGSSEEFAAIPENAEKVRVTLNFSSGEQSPYFRNLSLVLSDTHTVNTELTDWTVSGKLQIVQVGVTTTDHIVWIIFVALVAFGMFAVRKFMDKAKKVK